MKSPQKKAKGRRRWSAEERQHVVAEYFASGESLWRYSQRMEIGYGSLRNWVRRYPNKAEKREPLSNSFVELTASPQDSIPIAAATVRFPSGAEVTVHAGCDTRLAQTLVRSLR